MYDPKVEHFFSDFLFSQSITLFDKIFFFTRKGAYTVVTPGMLRPGLLRPGLLHFAIFCQNFENIRPGTRLVHVFDIFL